MPSPKRFLCRGLFHLFHLCMRMELQHAEGEMHSPATSGLPLPFFACQVSPTNGFEDVETLRSELFWGFTRDPRQKHDTFFWPSYTAPNTSTARFQISLEGMKIEASIPVKRCKTTSFFPLRSDESPGQGRRQHSKLHIHHIGGPFSFYLYSSSAALFFSSLSTSFQPTSSRIMLWDVSTRDPPAGSLDGSRPSLSLDPFPFLSLLADAQLA